MLPKSIRIRPPPTEVTNPRKKQSLVLPLCQVRLQTSTKPLIIKRCALPKATRLRLDSALQGASLTFSFALTQKKQKVKAVWRS